LLVTLIVESEEPGFESPAVRLVELNGIEVWGLVGWLKTLRNGSLSVVGPSLEALLVSTVDLRCTLGLRPAAGSLNVDVLESRPFASVDPKPIEGGSKPAIGLVSRNKPFGGPVPAGVLLSL
jgi:hypothetical protein